jgi:serine/threonine-protein kinase
MLLDEARISSRIRHPNVVQLLEVVHEHDELCLVMEYVHGVSLADVFSASRKEGRRVPAPIAVAIAVDVLRGLHAAHEARAEDGAPLGIVHRDVSPQNVLVGADGTARVLDFGVAKALRKDHLTISGEVKGKVAYMSPEQLRGGTVTRQADLFATGVLLWEALTGERLYVDVEGEPAAVMLKVLTDAPRPPSERAPDIPAGLDPVVLRALAHEPRARFANGEEMAWALADACPPAPPEELARFLDHMAAEELARRSRCAREAQERHVQDDPASSAPTPLRSVPVAGEEQTPKWHRIAAVGIVVGFVLIGALVGRAFRAHPVDDGPEPVPSGAEPSVSAVAPAPEPPAASPPVLEIDDLPTVKSPRPRVPRPKAQGGAKPNPCEPPYSIDTNGRKHYKPECLP